MSSNWTVEGWKCIVGSYDVRSQHEAAVIFEHEHGVEASSIESNEVIGRCCLCGVPILEDDDSRNTALPGLWVHWPACPKISADSLGLIKVERLVSFLVALPDGFSPDRKLSLRQSGVTVGVPVVPQQEES